MCVCSLNILFCLILFIKYAVSILVCIVLFDSICIISFCTVIAPATAAAAAAAGACF